MPLTRFQAALARLLATNRSPDSYLAGGAALHLEPNSKRYSKDLDYFHDSVERVAKAFDDDSRLLHEAGNVEWAHDSAWRFLPTIRTAEAGFQLHPVDLATNKLLALVGRDEPRDYLDVHEIISRILPLGPLCWAASGKDPGFTPVMLLDLLRRRGKYRAEDFARLDLVEPVDLPDLKRRWLLARRSSSRGRVTIPFPTSVAPAESFPVSRDREP